MKNKGLLLVPICLLALASCGKEAKKTITFNSEGGSEVASIRVKKNSRVDELPTPSKEGYSFIGWYLDEELNTKFSYVTDIKNDLTLYAKWSKNVQFSSRGLEHVNAAVALNLNYTVEFEYKDKSNNDGMIYFKIDGNKSEEALDKGILESNMDPDGITYMANNRQYMYSDRMNKYLYMSDMKYNNKLMNIYYYANYFKDSLLDTAYWLEADSNGNQYMDSNGYYYMNGDAYKLQILDDIIELTTVGGNTSFTKAWLDESISANISKIYKITFKNINSTKASIKLSDLDNAESLD